MMLEPEELGWVMCAVTPIGMPVTTRKEAEGAPLTVTERGVGRPPCGRRSELEETARKKAPLLEMATKVVLHADRSEVTRRNARERSRMIRTADSP